MQNPNTEADLIQEKTQKLDESSVTVIRFSLNDMSPFMVNGACRVKNITRGYFILHEVVTSVETAI